MKIIKYIFFILCLYIYLYNPIFQVLGFGIIKLLLFVSLIYLFFSKGFIFLFKYFKKEIIFTILLIVYSFSLVMILGNGTALMVPYQHAVWFLECFIIPIFLLFFFKDIFRKQSWEFLVAVVGTIASIITLYLIVNPEINLWVRESIIYNSLDAQTTILDFRGFSISEGSSFAYGIVQGFILSFCLFSIRKSFFYFIPIIPLLISILFNARIGFSTIIISLILLIIFKRIRIKSLIIGAVLVIAIIFLFNNSVFISENAKSMEWGLNFFEQTFSFVRGENNNETYSKLFDEMLFFPSSLSGIIFGEGRIVFAQSPNSDIGYVNQIFTGGIIYLLIMLFFLLYMYKRNLQYATDKLYPALFILSLLIVNIKGNSFFIPNGFFRLFTLYYVYCIFTAGNKIKQSTDAEEKL